MNKYLLHIFFAVAVLMLPACTDELPLPDGYIGDGESLISVDLEYEPSAEALGGQDSRSAGDALNEINSLSVVIYKLDGSLYRIYNKAQLLDFNNKLNNTDKPGDYGDKPAAEDTTARATFRLPDPLPFGKYYMYAVVNLGKDVTADMAKDQNTLRAQTVQWNFNDVKANAQMFGYFTNTDNKTSMGYQAPLLVVNRANTEIHSWVRRLASKVTIAYDGSKLHDEVIVYIHSATIKQVPLYCALGLPNKPSSTDSISRDSEDKAQHIFYYNTKGDTINDPGASDENFQKWMMVGNGTGIMGSDHSKKSNALFFYENMQGDYKDDPHKEWFNKVQNPDSVGSIIKPGMPDYKDNVPYGTYIEVSGYYVSRNAQNISEGPIKYRFMLGQNTTYNYDAIRNHHYKLTLRFNGWANQADWHIEYEQDDPDILAPPVYVPYLYNSSVEFPIKFRGKLISLEARIIENNWGPYDPSQTGPTSETGEILPIPAGEIGAADFDTRVLGFAWNRLVFLNAGKYTAGLTFPETPESGYDNNEYLSNYYGRYGNGTAACGYLFGRHKVPYYHLKDNGDGSMVEDTGKPYYVTPVWVGFLRLQQPEDLEGKELPATIFSVNSNWIYCKYTVIKGVRDYYQGKGGLEIDGVAFKNNNTDLGYRSFSAAGLTAGSHGTGRNSYSVESFVDTDGVPATMLKLQLWTQPKSMGYISGFTGNNPYEQYQRHAVVRLTGKFEITVNGHKETHTIIRDVDVFQSPRLVNPKGVWRRYNTKNKSFHVVLQHRDQAASSVFTPLQSTGSWSATITAGDKSFISLAAGNSTSGGGTSVSGGTGSLIDFTINFAGEIGQFESKCAIVEVRYHGNTCVHNILVRQGYNQPMSLISGGPRWSSFNVFNFAADTPFGEQNNEVEATMSVHPLALGSLFKKGNYAQGISLKSMETYGPFVAPGNGNMALTNNLTGVPWGNIYGVARKEGSNGTTTTTINGKSYNTVNWHWAKFRARIGNQVRRYRVPTYDDFATLDQTQYAVGVLYGDGATSVANTTNVAFGFFDVDNNIAGSECGMRGFFCYNPDDAHQIFFPIGSTGLARRTLQGISGTSYRGELRYSAVNGFLTQDYHRYDQFRPIPYNMKNAPGSIYWLSQEKGDYVGWDMNYFDLNINGYDYAASFGPYGDALPIRPIFESMEEVIRVPAMIPGRR